MLSCTIRTLAFVAGLLAFGAACDNRKPPLIVPIPDDTSQQQMTAAVANVRAGRIMTPKTWPDGARVAVCISFDVDNETLSRQRPLPIPLSEGEYGAIEGLPRILAVLDRYAIPASFYIPVMSAVLHPQMIPEIAKRRIHEIGVHGWIHEEPSTLGAGREAQLLDQSIAYLTMATGKRPTGFRAPTWDFSPATLQLIRKAGFVYDSSMMAMDQPYELTSNGKATGLIELPVSWIADDYPYYEPASSGSLPTPNAVYEIYRSEFEGAYREGTLFIVTMHPHITGHRSRISVLENLIVYMQSKPGVWFATLEQVARYVRQQDEAR